jgi:sulfite dehydrogenase
MKLLRTFFLLLIVISCKNGDEGPPARFDFFEKKDVLVRAPGKKEMILRSERPYNLETPQKYFLLDYTPNDVFFVRWHLSQLPVSVNTDTFRLRIHGNVRKNLSLSINDLKTKFHSKTISALAICSGNSRQQFNPRVPGVQWRNGAMGNAKWTGVALCDLLNAAGIKEGTVDIAFNGMDEPPLSATPDFIKTLSFDRAMDGEVIVAYEMNSDTIPMLNGFPLKLIVPGWYATYWIGMLNEIRADRDSFNGFWMKKAYLVPKGKTNGDETPDSLAQKTEPITRIAIRSVFISPENNTTIKENNSTEIQGLAFDDGDGISKVELSLDSGKSWTNTKLDSSLGKYSWRRWKYNWTPEKKGMHYLLTRATGTSGETQPAHQWNRSGYAKNEIELLEIFVGKK